MSDTPKVDVALNAGKAAAAMTNASVLERPEPTVQEETNYKNARAEGNVLFDPTILAKPLMIPGARLKLKDSTMIPYWANKSAGDGRRVMILKEKGFTFAKELDLKDGSGLAANAEGHIVSGDRILMIVKKELYYGHLKFQADMATARLGKDSIFETGKRQLRQALSEVSGSSSQKAKLEVFIPGDKDKGFEQISK